MTRSALPIFIIAVVAAVGSSGCSRRVPSATVVLVDPSASVTERARRNEFAAVATLIPRMQRGDLLTIIPITDNAAADIEGRVLRFHAPERREAYDADLRRFRERAEKQFEEFAANLLGHPGQRTDILGALDVARQEFDAIPNADRRELIVLSDFLEDDGTYRFAADRNLADPAHARRLARRLAQAHEFTLRGVATYPGGLQSGDFARLDPARQASVRAFWYVYLPAGGERSEIHLDGTGMLARLSQ